mmetsp:Transcript_22046/g.64022  ORF Transcript_22046/g.64022 Transcript_22046/m.64022 type:complete len:201 (+) Transcript_22046:270-872(+)
MDQLAPPSSISSSNLCGRDATNCCKLARCSASQHASSENVPRGSRLKRMEPENRCGCCGMTEMDSRSRDRGIVVEFTPSIHTSPPQISLSRLRARRRLDLPLPVRPTMPTFCPPPQTAETPWRTSGRSSRYRTRRSLKMMCPSEGQSVSIFEEPGLKPAGGSAGSSTPSASSAGADIAVGVPEGGSAFCRTSASEGISWA